MTLLLASLLFAQIAAPATLADDRLRICMSQARNDPATAIGTANAWLEEAVEVERSYPRQCLGFAYTSLLRWEAARDAFVTARDVRAAADFTGRARLGGMAGNAAIAAEDFGGALAILDAAQADALAGGRAQLAGTIAADRARAFVGLEQDEQATAALENAREWAPQVADVWLLSATLARRMNDLASAQAHIRTANLLAPQNAAIGLEAGLIAALSGDDTAARTAWQSVIAVDREAPEAATARAYLAQLEEGNTSP